MQRQHQHQHQPGAHAAQTLGARLRQRRWGELRVFQAVLAEAVGISPAQLCEIERGSAGTTPITLWKIARALELDFAELRAQAEREGVLTRLRERPTPSPSPTDPVARRDLPSRPARPRPAATKPWLSTDEAAAILGCTIHTVAYLIRRGRLQPAIKLPKSRQGQRRWLVDAGAVERYDPPNDGRQWRHRRHAAPEGYLSVDEFAHQAGLPKPTLYRRLAEWRINSIKIGQRRWIRENELARFHEHAGTGFD
ncbi:MAG: helix-turn-helix domain-containing protein [Thermomicrobiales bacterium]